MKKTIIKISIIFLILFSYCFTEMVFLDVFTEKMYQMVLRLQNESDNGKMHEIYRQMEAHIEDKEIWLDIMMPKTELEMIRVSLGRVRDYLAEDQNFEARVSAGEIVGYLKEINASLNLKK